MRYKFVMGSLIVYIHDNTCQWYLHVYSIVYQRSLRVGGVIASNQYCTYVHTLGTTIPTITQVQNSYLNLIILCVVCTRTYYYTGGLR